MQDRKISQAEFPLMEYIWENHPIAATELVSYAKKHLNWSKSTTYTVIKRLTERGILLRTEPGCIVEPLVSRDWVEQDETDELITRIFRGSPTRFMTAFLKGDRISAENLEALKKLIEEKQNENH